MKSCQPKLLMTLIATLTALVAPVYAQSNVGELLEKGGKQLGKSDVLELVPLRYQSKWPNGQGEEELFFTSDGNITGTGYHYGSRSNSPATGQWKVDEDGRVCTPKTFTAWNSSTNMCWYLYRLNDGYYSTAKSDLGSRVGRINTLEKVAVQ
ncbi:MAG: hypothetical protein RL323_2096 [Pseudomonadota bacterium]